MRRLAILLTLVVSVLCVSVPAFAGHKHGGGARPHTSAPKASHPAKAPKVKVAKKPSKHAATARAHHGNK